MNDFSEFEGPSIHEGYRDIINRYLDLLDVKDLMQILTLIQNTIEARKTVSGDVDS